MLFPLTSSALDGAAWWTWLYTTVSIVAYVLALLSVPSVLMKRRGRPHAALSWVLILFLLPLVGLFFWWVIGRQHLDRKRRQRRVATRRRSGRLASIADTIPTDAQEDWEILPVRRLPDPEKDWFFPPTRGNRIELLVDAEQTYPAIEEAIRSAERFIHLMFYIWEDDETGRYFRDLLTEKARQGVEVRLLVDAIGTYTLRRGFMRPLLEAGAQVATFSPLAFFRRSLEINFRNHRKLVLSDTGAAVMGGLNIGNEYRQQWRDMALAIQGPIVDHLQEIFADDWFYTTKEDFIRPEYFGTWHEEKVPASGKGHLATCGIVASGPHTLINLMQEAFFIALNRAGERIWITTPYFVPDQPILAALRAAAFRGLDVRIIIPDKSDSMITTFAGRSYYPELLRAGVRIFESSGAFLHTKLAIIDKSLSVVGSANVDIRSFRLNFELNCFLDSLPLTEDLARLFGKYLGSSREISLEEAEKRPYAVRLAESAAHLASPLL